MDDVHNNGNVHKKIQDVAKYDGGYQRNFEKNLQ